MPGSVRVLSAAQALRCLCEALAEPQLSWPLLSSCTAVAGKEEAPSFPVPQNNCNARVCE